MIYTLETRLTVTPEVDAILAANAAHWSFGVRFAWSALYRQRLSEKDVYRRICELGFTSKQAESILAAAQMRKAALVELKKYERGQLELAIDKRTRAIADKRKKVRALERRERKLCAVRARHSPAAGKSRSRDYLNALSALRALREDLSFCRHWIAQKERVLRAKQGSLKRLIEDMAADRYSLCFGSKDLLRQRPGVIPTEFPAFETLEDWQRTWDCARNGQFWAIGHTDLPGGNSTIQWQPDSQQLRIRLTDKLAEERMDARGIPHAGGTACDMPARMQCRFIDINEVDFTSHRGVAGVALRVAIGTTPITMRVLSRLEASGARAWYVQASFEIEPPPPQLTRDSGVLGVDFNAHGLAWCAVKPDGNRLVTEAGPQVGSIPWQLKGAPAGGRREAMGVTVATLVAKARALEVGIAIENLDFATKKRSMRAGAVNRPYNEMLGALPSAQFVEMLSRACEQEGIGLYIVNPLYSSVGGYTKYGRALRLNADTAAALWLGRQALYGRILRREGYSFFVKKFDERLVFSHLPVTPMPSMTALAGVQWKDVARALGKHRRQWGREFREWVISRVDAASAPHKGEPDRAFVPTG